MAAVISFVSAKGGVGKTTLSVNFAVELAYRGYSVRLVDCDLNQHASRFGEIFVPSHPDLDIGFLSDVDEKNVGAVIRDVEGDTDIVVVDLPAGTSQAALKAIMKSHMVVIPSQKTTFDTRDAARTLYQVWDAEGYMPNKVASVVIWSRVMPRIETRNERTVRSLFDKMVVNPEQALLPASLLEYDAFPAGFLNTWVPRELADKAGEDVVLKQKINGRMRDVKITVPRSAARAAENVAGITDALLERLSTVTAGGEIPRAVLKPEIIKQMSGTSQSAGERS